MNNSNAKSLSKTKLQHLPLEMLDIILMKAILIMESNSVKMRHYMSDGVVLRIVVVLQTVTSVWNDRLNTNWFRIMYKRRRKRIEETLSYCPVLVRRAEWSARDPTSINVLNEPVPMVVISNTVEPDECFDTRRCTQALQYMQNYFIDVKGWADIAYNFVIGEDGRVYEGRGWKVHGAHTLNYNDSSIGIGIIGFFGDRAPSNAALKATQELLRLGVKEGHIDRHYSLYGHRDLRPYSKSPGRYLYEIIRSWPNYESMSTD